METIHIEICNWDKIQSKTDTVRHPYWFKVNNRIMTSSSLFKLKPSQKWIWICLLSICSQRLKSRIALDVAHFSHLAGVSKNDVFQTIEILSKNGTVTVDCQSNDSEVTHRLDKTRLDKIRKETTIAQFALSDTDLDLIYADYPRKIGKAEGYKKFKKLIKSEKDLEDLKQAVKNYAVLNQEKEKEFIKHFSTFANCWRDHIELAKDEIKKSVFDIIAEEEKEREARSIQSRN